MIRERITKQKRHLAYLAPQGGSSETSVLLPVADNSSQGSFGTASILSFSQWNHAAIRFDLSSLTQSIGGATLRLYYQSSGELELRVLSYGDDQWDEGGIKPNRRASEQVLGAEDVAGPGYVEFDVTDYVIQEWQSDGLASFGITSNSGAWRYLASREGYYTPELLVDGIAVEVPELSSIAVEPSTAELEVGETLLFTAGGLDQFGNAFGTNVQWSVNGGGHIDASGFFSAESAGGPFTVSATDGDIIGTASIVVVEPEPPEPVLTTLQILPDMVEIELGSTQLFNVEGFDQNGLPIALSPQWGTTFRLYICRGALYTL